MRYLYVLGYVDALPVFLGKPFAGEPQPRVDSHPLVRDLNRVLCWLVGDLKAFLDKGVNTARARCTEPSGELLINLDPFINR